MIPFVESFTKKLDLKGKRIEMQLPEGMLELDAPLERGEEGPAADGEAIGRGAATEGRKCGSRLSPSFRTSSVVPWITALCAGRATPGSLKSESTTCGRLPQDRHRTVDDRPFGGGEGMLLKPDPLFECVESLGVAAKSRAGERRRPGNRWCMLSASGKMFTQAMAQELAGLERITFLCGRYEGVDERVTEYLADREVSVGDFVMSGGELGSRAHPGLRDTSAARSTGQRGFGKNRKLQRRGGRGKVRRARKAGAGFDDCNRRPAGLSALHAPRGISRDGGSGSADEWEP